MSSKQGQRPSFYEEQYLGADDLNAAVEYGRGQQARHALGAHTWGIAAGLQLSEKPAPAGGGQVDVYVQPGYAWDGFGRPVVVLAPFKIPAELFQAIVYDAVLDGNAPEGRLLEIWLRYDEQALNPPPPGFGGCAQDGQFARVQETFRIEIGPRHNHGEQHQPVALAGFAVDAQQVEQRLRPQTPPVLLYDESVAYQDFPADNPKARWLLPLGSLRWKPHPDPRLPGHFVQRAPADLQKSASQRVYAGVVAGSVYAADRSIRLRDRHQDYASRAMSDDLVWVQGDLRVEGDAHLFNGMLDFRDANGLDHGVPLALRRRAGPGNTASLQAVIGRDGQGGNAFAVGPLETNPPPNAPAQLLTKFTVLDNGKVGVGTANPQLTLDIQGDFGRANGPATLHLFGSHVTDAGNGVLSLRSGGGVVAFDGADHVGIGTADPKSSLQVAGDVALEQRAGSNTARALPNGATMLWNDGKWLRLNQNLNYTQPVFGVHTPGLFASGSLNVGGGGNWGDPGLGNLWVSGRVGIGTTSPSLPLDIQGDFGRDNGPATVHLFGSRIGDIGDGVLSLKSGGGVVAFDGGDKVGVGLKTPVCKLHVADSLNGDAAFPSVHVALLENTQAGGSADVLALKVGAAVPGAGNNFITFFGGNGAVGRIEGNGGGGVVFASGGADFAECLPRLRGEETLEIGDVVGVFAGRIGKATAGAQHVAAITGRPIVVGNRPAADSLHLYGEVALLGQVRVKVRGPVGAGDLIVPSGLDDGVGVAVPPGQIGLEPAQIVGTAWESSSAVGVKTVNVAVGLAPAAAWSNLAAALRAQQAEIDALRAELRTLAALLGGQSSS